MIVDPLLGLVLAVRRFPKVGVPKTQLRGTIPVDVHAPHWVLQGLIRLPKGQEVNGRNSRKQNLPSVVRSFQFHRQIVFSELIRRFQPLFLGKRPVVSPETQGHAHHALGKS